MNETRGIRDKRKQSSKLEIQDKGKRGAWSYQLLGEWREVLKMTKKGRKKEEKGLGSPALNRSKEEVTTEWEAKRIVVGNSRETQDVYDQTVWWGTCRVKTKRELWFIQQSNDQNSSTRNQEKQSNATFGLYDANWKKYLTHVICRHSCIFLWKWNMGIRTMVVTSLLLWFKSGDPKPFSSFFHDGR